MSFIYCHLNFHANMLRPWRFPLTLFRGFFPTKKSVSSQYTLINRHYSSEHFVKKIRIDKRSLKIPKSESSINRRTDNTMAKSKCDKKTSNDLQNSTQNNKGQATRTPLETGVGLVYSGKVGNSCSTSGTRHVSLVTNQGPLLNL
jgi:hypothetical protein